MRDREKIGIALGIVLITVFGVMAGQSWRIHHMAPAIHEADLTRAKLLALKTGQLTDWEWMLEVDTDSLDSATTRSLRIDAEESYRKSKAEVETLRREIRELESGVAGRP